MSSRELREKSQRLGPPKRSTMKRVWRHFTGAGLRRSNKSFIRPKLGPVWLSDSRVARVVAESLEFQDGKVYRLDAYCIMSNHVHVVFKPFLDERSISNKEGAERLSLESGDATLGVIMHSIKSYTANRANRLLCRSGPFWETESYDHFIRNESEYRRVIAYVLNNPVKAGLIKDWREWQWSWKRNHRKHFN